MDRLDLLDQAADLGYMITIYHMVDYVNGSWQPDNWRVQIEWWDGKYWIREQIGTGALDAMLYAADKFISAHQTTQRTKERTAHGQMN